MQIISFPKKSDWPAVVARPTQSIANIEKAVVPILEKVRTEGDAAIRALTLQFDKIALDDIAMPQTTIDAAEAALSEELKAAIRQAYQTSRLFTRHNTNPYRKSRRCLGLRVGAKAWELKK